jgi:hypothetical protein
MLALCYVDLFQGLICQDEQFNEITHLVTIFQITNYKSSNIFCGIFIPSLIVLMLLLNSSKNPLKQNPIFFLKFDSELS